MAILKATNVHIGSPLTTNEEAPISTAFKQKDSIYENVVSTLVNLFSQLSEEVTDHAALKLHHNRAKHTLDMRVAEYDKGKQFHEKYPSTEESQRRAKEEAENEFRTIDNNLATKAASLNTTAAAIASHVVPKSTKSIEADRLAHEKLRERCDALEETCRELERKYEQQKKISEEQEQQSAQLRIRFDELEKSQRTEQGEMRGAKTREDAFGGHVQSQVLAATREASQANEKVADMEAKLLELSEGLADTNTRLAKEVEHLVERNNNLSSKIESFELLRALLTTQLNEVKEDLSKINTALTECQQIIDQSEQRDQERLKLHMDSKELEKLKESIGNLHRGIYGDKSTKGLYDTVLELAQDEQHFRDELRKAGDRMTLEMKNIDERLRSEFKERDGKLVKLERTAMTEDKVTATIAAVKFEFLNSLKRTEQEIQNKSAALRLTHGIAKDVTVRPRSPAATEGSEAVAKFIQISKAEFEDFKTKVLDFKAGQERADEMTGRFLETLQEDTAKLAACYKKLDRQLQNDILSDLEQLKDQNKLSMSKIDNRIGVLESQQSSLTQRLEGYNSRSTVLEGLLEGNQKKLEDQASLMQRRLDHLSRIQEERCSALDSAPEGELPRHRVSQQEISRQSPQRTSSATQTSDLHTRIGVIELGLASLTSRMDNINTLELAQNMISQLENVYPNLRNTETIIAQHDKTLNELRNALSSNITSVSRILSRLEELSAQMQGLREHRSLKQDLAKRGGGVEAIAHNVRNATHEMGQVGGRSVDANNQQLNQLSRNYQFPSQQLASTNRIISQGSSKRKSPGTPVLGTADKQMKRVRKQSEEGTENSRA